MRRTTTVVWAFFLALGCAGPSGTGGSTSAVVSAPAEGEGVQRADVDHATTPTPPAAIADADALIAIHALPGGEAEDGTGHVVQSSAPVAIDLDAHAFPPRALDPVLAIGQSRFHHYTHPHAGVLRFVIADASLLVRGASMSVAYLEDGSDARVLVAAIGEAEESAARQP
jgi:hypothetical protein